MNQIHKNVPLIEEYLLKHGFKIERKTLGPSPFSKFTFITSPNGSRLILSTSALILPFQTSAAKGIMDNKLRAYDFAEFCGIRIPATIYVNALSFSETELGGMLEQFATLIVKPHNGFQSRGLTIDITNMSDLKHAIQEAAAISNTVIIQEQVIGEEIRLITIDGTVKAALLRQKPQVVGDGSSSVAELIAVENDSRLNITSTMVSYPQLDETMVAPELLNSTWIPAAGEVVKLSNKTMIRGGASVYDIIGSIDRSYIDIAEKMAGWFGKGLTCVDLMVKDYTEPASSTNYAFIEFNGAISIAMCYSCRDGKHFPLLDDYVGPMLINAIG